MEHTMRRTFNLPLGPGEHEVWKKNKRRPLFVKGEEEIVS
jgi:hypothetical protein